MSKEVKASNEQKEVFTFLNDLRESGATNMFGAVPYIQNEFGYDKNTCKQHLALWMSNFRTDGDYDTITVDD